MLSYLFRHGSAQYGNQKLLKQICHVPQRYFLLKVAPIATLLFISSSFINSLLTDLKKAHKFSSILLSQLHSNEAQLHATLLVFITSCAAVGVPFKKKFYVKDKLMLPTYCLRVYYIFLTIAFVSLDCDYHALPIFL